jgi:segregation and condensation protein A
MAATLIRIKVQMLLPSPAEDGEEEEDPREQLVRQLVLYKKFKEAAGSLSGREDERRDFFPRGVDVKAFEELAEDGVETEELLKDVSLFDLVDALREVLSRIPRRIDVHNVSVETVTVEGEMERIRAVMAEKGFVTFAGLFRPTASRGEIVTTFIALLELIRQNAVLAIQERVFGEITIRMIPEEQT